MNELATQNKPATPTIRGWLQTDEFRAQIAHSLPLAMRANATRFARIALTATFKQPKLLECTQQSLFNCLLRLSELGIEPDGRRAHLIPFGKECTLIIDYKGISELVRRNGEVAHIHCDVIGENDEFDYQFGTGGRLHHKPNLHDRGRIWAAYSYVRLKDGTEEFDVMGVAEIEHVRKRSRAANDGPWVTDWNEMAKKTVFRRHAKMLPLSAEARELIEADDEPLTETERFKAAVPASATVAAPPTPTLPRRGRPPKPQTQNSEPATEGHFTEPQRPQESVSASQQTESPPEEQNAAPSQLERLRALLGQHGFSEANLVELLHRFQIIDAKCESLEQVSPVKLQIVLDDWDNCLRHLQQIIAGK